MERNLLIFQRDSLSERKFKVLTNPLDLEDYLSRAHFPTIKDLARLRKLVDKHRLIYDRAVKPVRNQFLAHRIVNQAESRALYNAGKVQEFWKLNTFLLKFHITLWEQFHNGRKPILHPMRYSVKSIYNSTFQTSDPHESIVADVKRLMQFIEFSTLDSRKSKSET